MWIIIKFLLTNIREKKLRTVLIILSIALSGALVFGTMGMGTTMKTMYAKRLTQYYGEADIMIRSNPNIMSWGYSTYQFRDWFNRFEYAVGTIWSGGEFKHQGEYIGIGLRGFEWNDLQTFNPPHILEDGGILPFQGLKLIISSSTAERYGWQVGSRVTIKVGGTPRRFVVAGIAQTAGILMDDGSREPTALIPLNTLSSFYGLLGKVSQLFIKVPPSENKVLLTAELQNAFPKFRIEETVSEEWINGWSQNMTIPLKIMLVLVMGISSFIIFTCFQVITAERMPVIGTFRSIGATRSMTDFVLFAESFVYGTLGGLIGCGLGVGVLYLLVQAFFGGGWMTQNGIILDFTAGQLIASFLISLGLSVFSAAVPIFKVSRIPVKEIILNLGSEIKKRGFIRLIIGSFLILGSLFIPAEVGEDLAIAVHTIRMAAVLVGGVSLVPYVTRLFVLIFEKIYMLIFGNIGFLAAMNLRENKKILNNISLLTIGIASMFMINTISTSTALSLSQTFRDANFQIVASRYPCDRNLESVLRTIPGVEETFGYYKTSRVDIEGETLTIRSLYGYRADKFDDFFKFSYDQPVEDILARMNDERVIILNSMYKESLNIDIGDTITLERDRKRDFVVDGFFTTLLDNGECAIIGERYAKQDFGERFYDDIAIQTSEPPEIVKAGIREKFNRRYISVWTVAEIEQMEIEGYQDIFSILRAFSMLTLAIGAIGVVNNFIISFLDRKRLLAVYRSVGMSKGQTIVMLFIESFSSGLIGAVSGIFGGILLLFVLPPLLKATGLVILLQFFPLMALLLLAAGVTITLLASIGPVLRSSKLNLIEEIKYE